MMFRAGRYLFAFIPYMIFFYYSREDREYKANILTMRTFCENIINERKRNLEKFKDNPDLLTILCMDELFADDTKAMIDEIITFFLAGSFTLKSTNSNLIQYLALNPKVYCKLMSELKETILKEHLSGVNQAKPVDTKKEFTFESVEPLRYFINCFYEALRIETPTVASGGIFTEPQSILGVNIRKNDLFIINMQQIHNDSTEWIAPERFIPERFESSSQYYLRPDGKKRNPFSFSPFLGGKRICLGKTFAEIVAKFVVPALLSRFEFEFVDTDLRDGLKEKPKLNLDMDEEPVVMMTIKKVNLLTI